MFFIARFLILHLLSALALADSQGFGYSAANAPAQTYTNPILDGVGADP
jgi:hypothetical protein